MARKSPSGVATTNLIHSARVGANAELFARILMLHVPAGSIVADVTYGRGTFWKLVQNGVYQLKATDIQTGADFKRLPYESNSIDCVILDPPYLGGMARDAKSSAGQGTHSEFRAAYGGGTVAPKRGSTLAWHEVTLDLYLSGGKEAHRVLRNNGLLIVKCQDEVCGGKQFLTHVEIINAYAIMGFYAKDLFVLVRSNKPGVSRMLKQVHARKNHSYFFIFRKIKQD